MGHRATLAARREELCSITALQRRRLALQASSLAALCDPMVQTKPWWSGLQRAPCGVLLPVLLLLALRRSKRTKPNGLARRVLELWRLCRRPSNA